MYVESEQGSLAPTPRSPALEADYLGDPLSARGHRPRRPESVDSATEASVVANRQAIARNRAAIAAAAQSAAEAEAVITRALAQSSLSAPSLAVAAFVQPGSSRRPSAGESSVLRDRR
ncbi:hypothetical protein DIPPA_32222 [Diplonema papillatum]|nr:hypothetical protein DIPPA_32222 [Diplonema papillatum]